MNATDTWQMQKNKRMRSKVKSWKNQLKEEKVGGKVVLTNHHHPEKVHPCQHQIAIFMWRY